MLMPLSLFVDARVLSVIIPEGVGLVTNGPIRPGGVAVSLAGLRRDFREYYVFFGVVTREFVALERRAVPWREVAAHRDPNALAALLRVRRGGR